MISDPIRLEPSDQAIRLAHFATHLRFDSLPYEVIQQTLLIVRDTLGTMLAGSTLPEVHGLASLASTWGGAGNASLMGHAHTTTPHFAALVNGTGGVSLELDEGNQYAINHPAVHILPATLALAEDQEVSGKEFLTAFIAGYEIAVRVGRATKLRQAVHPFGTHAIVGTAAAASRIMGLDVAETARALELAAGLTLASSQSAANAGASARNLFTGFTNHNGLLAPLLVKAGFNGEPDAMNVVYGQVLGNAFTGDDLGADLKHEYYLTRNYFKIHACSRWNHAPIEATTKLLEKAVFTADDVVTLTVWTYDPATRLSGGDVTNGYAAKHSIPYNVAARIVHGANDLSAYQAEAVNDPRLQNLLQRIEIKEDPAFTAMLPDVRPARVEVRLKSGEVHSEQVERPRGGFDNPLTEDELAEKFRYLAGMAMSDDAVNAIMGLIPQLPELETLKALSSLLRNNA